MWLPTKGNVFSLLIILLTSSPLPLFAFPPRELSSLEDSEVRLNLKQDGRETNGRNIRPLSCQHRETGQIGVCMFAWDCMKVNGTHLGTCIDRFYFGSCCDLGDRTEQVLQTIATHSSMRPPLRPVVSTTITPRPIVELGMHGDMMKYTTMQTVHEPVQLHTTPSPLQKSTQFPCPPGLGSLCGEKTTTTGKPPSADQPAPSSTTPSSSWPNWPSWTSSTQKPPSGDEPGNPIFPVLPGFPEWGTTPGTSLPPTPEPTVPQPTVPTQPPVPQPSIPTQPSVPQPTIPTNISQPAVPEVPMVPGVPTNITQPQPPAIPEIPTIPPVGIPSSSTTPGPSHADETQKPTQQPQQPFPTGIPPIPAVPSIPPVGPVQNITEQFPVPVNNGSNPIPNIPTDQVPNLNQTGLPVENIQNPNLNQTGLPVENIPNPGNLQNATMLPTDKFPNPVNNTKPPQVGDEPSNGFPVQIPGAPDNGAIPQIPAIPPVGPIQNVTDQFPVPVNTTNPGDIKPPAGFPNTTTPATPTLPGSVTAPMLPVNGAIPTPGPPAAGDEPSNPGGLPIQIPGVPENAIPTVPGIPPIQNVTDQFPVNPNATNPGGFPPIPGNGTALPGVGNGTIPNNPVTPPPGLPTPVAPPAGDEPSNPGGLPIQIPGVPENGVPAVPSVPGIPPIQNVTDQFPVNPNATNPGGFPPIPGNGTALPGVGNGTIPNNPVTPPPGLPTPVAPPAGDEPSNPGGLPIQIPGVPENAIPTVPGIPPIQNVTDQFPVNPNATNPGGFPPIPGNGTALPGVGNGTIPNNPVTPPPGLPTPVAPPAGDEPSQPPQGGFPTIPGIPPFPTIPQINVTDPAGQLPGNNGTLPVPGNNTTLPGVPGNGTIPNNPVTPPPGLPTPVAPPAGDEPSNPGGLPIQIPGVPENAIPTVPGIPPIQNVTDQFPVNPNATNPGGFPPIPGNGTALPGVGNGTIPNNPVTPPPGLPTPVAPPAGDSPQKPPPTFPFPVLPGGPPAGDQPGGGLPAIPGLPAVDPPAFPVLPGPPAGDEPQKPPQLPIQIPGGGGNIPTIPTIPSVPEATQPTLPPIGQFPEVSPPAGLPGSSTPAPTTTATTTTTTATAAPSPPQGADEPSGGIAIPSIPTVPEVPSVLPNVTAPTVPSQLPNVTAPGEFPVTQPTLPSTPAVTAPQLPTQPTTPSTTTPSLPTIPNVSTGIPEVSTALPEVSSPAVPSVSPEVPQVTVPSVSPEVPQVTVPSTPEVPQVTIPSTTLPTTFPILTPPPGLPSDDGHTSSTSKPPAFSTLPPISSLPPINFTTLAPPSWWPTTTSKPANDQTPNPSPPSPPPTPNLPIWTFPPLRPSSTLQPPQQDQTTTTTSKPPELPAWTWPSFTTSTLPSITFSTPSPANLSTTELPQLSTLPPLNDVTGLPLLNISTPVPPTLSSSTPSHEGGAGSSSTTPNPIGGLPPVTLPSEPALPNNNFTSLPTVSPTQVPAIPTIPAINQTGLPTIPEVPATNQTGLPMIPEVPATNQTGLPTIPEVPANQTGIPALPTIPEVPANQTGIPALPTIPEVPTNQTGIPAIPAVPAVPEIPTNQTGALPTPFPVFIPGQNTSSSTTTSAPGGVKVEEGGTAMDTVMDESFFSENGTLLINDYKKICGRRFFPTSRIVGGKEATYGKWPWQISLRQWRTSTYLHKCGAALLNENWAITAAHCVEKVPPTDLLLRIGEFDLSDEKEPYGYVERRVQIVATHPQFDARTFEYDLALLRFYEPITFQPNIVPVCVPENDDAYLGKTGFVTGWGRLYEDGPLPSRLQEVPVPVINNEACESMYRAAGYIEHIPNIFICAGWGSGGKDSCEGDSGGPLVLQREADKRWTLGGVISWGIGCAEPNQPGVYTRISEFRNWIGQILQF